MISKTLVPSWLAAPLGTPSVSPHPVVARPVVARPVVARLPTVPRGMVSPRRAGVQSSVVGQQRITARMWLLVIGLIGSGLVLSVCGRAVRGVEISPWEYSPYRIQIWAQLGPLDESAIMNERLRKFFVERSEAVAGATWKIDIVAPPDSIRSDLLHHLDRLEIDPMIELAGESLEKYDKIVLLSIDGNAVQHTVRAREFDCRMRLWGPTADRIVRQPQRLLWDAFEVTCDAFHPVARIENVTGKDAIVRVRARGLIYGDPPPAAIRPQQVLQPIVRMNDRLGKPRKNGIQPIPWTYLFVTKEARTTLECRVYSGRRGALGGRTSSRIERYASLVRPLQNRTFAEVRTRGTNNRPLMGYEIYAKHPFVEQAELGKEEAEQTPAELLGQTDWRGQLEIPPAEFPLRVLYVKSGAQLLARMPIVPGWDTIAVAEVPNDDQRLQAEGYVKGIQATVMDVVSRRELFRARIRRQIKEKQFEEAQKSLDELRALPTREQLLQSVSSQQARLSEKDKTAQGRIDTLFGNARSLVSKYINSRAAEDMARELAQARSAG